MRHFYLPTLLVWLFQIFHFTAHNHVEAFQSVSNARQTMQRATTLVAPASLQQNVDENTRTRTKRPRRTRTSNNNKVMEERDDPSALTFRGRIAKTSRPLVSVQDKEYMIEFFKSEKARNTLFVSDAPPKRIDPVPPQLFADWRAEAEKLGVAIPSSSEADQQTVMQLCSNGISFSGLTVETTVFCGSKLMEDDPVTGLPAYELTMINDTTKARGPRLLMWIYNQVMGVVSSSNSNNNKSKTTTSLCRIALVETKNGGMAINFESTFQVKMKFPRFLLKVLPVSKTRAEQQGSSAVMSFVEKGVVDSLHRFEKAFAESSRLAP